MLYPDIVEYIVKKHASHRFLQISTSGLVNLDALIKIDKKYNIDMIQISNDGVLPKLSYDAVFDIAGYRDVEVNCVLSNRNVYMLNDMLDRYYKVSKKIYPMFAIQEPFPNDTEFYETLEKEMELNHPGLSSTVIASTITTLLSDQHGNMTENEHKYAPIVIAPDGSEHSCEFMYKIMPFDEYSTSKRVQDVHCDGCKHSVYCGGGKVYERYAEHGHLFKEKHSSSACLYYEFVERLIKNKKFDKFLFLSNSRKKVLVYESKKNNREILLAG